MTKLVANSPFLLNDEGTRYVGIRHPDGTESEFVFADDNKKPPAAAKAQAPQGRSEVQ